MGPVSEEEQVQAVIIVLIGSQSFSFDCYFRQSWYDKRLTFVSDIHKTLPLGLSMLTKIWKPDTYFWNGKSGYLHTLTTDNRLVRLSADGLVLYSSRLDLFCPSLGLTVNVLQSD
jgi:hypothetical protein